MKQILVTVCDACANPIHGDPLILIGKVTNKDRVVESAPRDSNAYHPKCFVDSLIKPTYCNTRKDKIWQVQNWPYNQISETYAYGD